MQVARVVIFGKYADIEKPLDYLIPAGLEVTPGSIVRVPLGSRVVEGVVTSRPELAQVPDLKKVLALNERKLPQEFLELAPWLAVQAGCSTAQALSAMLPPAGTGQAPLRWQLDDQAAANLSLTEKQGLVADFMRNQTSLAKAEIARALAISTVPIDNLIAKGGLKPAEDTLSPTHWDLPPVRELTADQAAVLDQVGRQKSGVFVLHGVAGSGKTEVYIRLARQVLAAGRQVLVLAPEIALTAQLVARYRAAFGPVSLWHSSLAGSQRAAQWDKIYRGEARVVVGTRSAVFAPFADLGLVVIDEEHELAYKQEEAPRYHARDVAVFRARHHGAILLLGSATPSLETYSRAHTGHWTPLCMPRRVFAASSLEAEIVDMRKELSQGNRGMLSRALTQALTDTLARKEQALLFLNRRGVAPSVLCRNCGFRYTCPNCSTSMTLHDRGLLRCHHCGASGRVALACPRCGSKYLRELGVGTQKLETLLASLFPGTSLSRLDGDTAGTASGREKRLYDFYRQESGILLGTQMIAKGLDFPKVSLVGVVLADLSLAMPDFRAAERTFQLVTQAGGRTGRAELPGRVIIQTYQPDHYSLQHALAGDYPGFYRQEMAVRKKAGLPPFSALTRIVLSAREQGPLLKQARILESLLEQEGFALLFSGPPPLERLKGRWRWHFILRLPPREPWQRVAKLRREVKPDRAVRLVIDNNPYSFM